LDCICRYGVAIDRLVRAVAGESGQRILRI
jgi:hypothetical protein